MTNGNVLRVNAVEEEKLFRDAVHRVIARILAEHDGLTLIDISEHIGVSTKTISNAFNKTHSLSQIYLNRLAQAFGVHVLDPIGALAGGRMLPMATNGDKDLLPRLITAALRIAEARDRNGSTGGRETSQQRAAYLPDLLALRRELDLQIQTIETELGA